VLNPSLKEASDKLSHHQFLPFHFILFSSGHRNVLYYHYEQSSLRICYVAGRFVTAAPLRNNDLSGLSYRKEMITRA
jgi:hypothetical protein